MSSRELTVDAEMEELQHKSFTYFLHQTNPVNGLVIDKTVEDWPASSAATGYQGFYYHFLDMQTGRRAWELVKTALAADFSGAERHRSRLAKVAELEGRETP